MIHLATKSLPLPLIADFNVLHDESHDTSAAKRLILCLYILAFICFFFPSFFFSSHVSAFVLRRLTRDEDHEDYRMGGVGGS